MPPLQLEDLEISSFVIPSVLLEGAVVKDNEIFKRFHSSQTENATITSISNNKWHLHYAIVLPDPYIPYTQDF